MSIAMGMLPKTADCESDQSPYSARSVRTSNDGHARCWQDGTQHAYPATPREGMPPSLLLREEPLDHFLRRRPRDERDDDQRHRGDEDDRAAGIMPWNR